MEETINIMKDINKKGDDKKKGRTVATPYDYMK